MKSLDDNIAAVRTVVDRFVATAEEFGGNVSGLRFSRDIVFATLKRFLEEAPAATGDRVELVETPEITPEKSWGWMGSKHFLVKGARGTVDSLWAHSETGQLGADVMFDDESWKDHNGIAHPPERRSLYAFGLRWLRRVDDEPKKDADR